MNYTTAKYILSCGNCWKMVRPILPMILLGLMACLLPIGLVLFLSDTAQSAGQALIIIGGVASGMFLIICCWTCCSAAQEEARKTVQAARQTTPKLHIRTPRVETEESLPDLVPDTVIPVAPVQSSLNSQTNSS